MQLGIFAEPSSYTYAPALKLIILGWLLVAALIDARNRIAPDWLMFPGLIFSFIWRMLHPLEWLPWGLSLLMVALCLAGSLPGGDMKGLVAMALFDPNLFFMAWIGAGCIFVLWRLVRRERHMPGYVGFLAGGFVWIICAQV